MRERNHSAIPEGETVGGVDGAAVVELIRQTDGFEAFINDDGEIDAREKA